LMARNGKYRVSVDVPHYLCMELRGGSHDTESQEPRYQKPATLWIKSTYCTLQCFNGAMLEC
jgi:hypothetical protein